MCEVGLVLMFSGFYFSAEIGNCCLGWNGLEMMIMNGSLERVCGLIGEVVLVSVLSSACCSDGKIW